MASSHSFVPGLGLHALTGFYDGLIARLLAKDQWRDCLASIMAPAPCDIIVDLGCGTSTLAIKHKATSGGGA